MSVPLQWPVQCSKGAAANTDTYPLSVSHTNILQLSDDFVTSIETVEEGMEEQERGEPVVTEPHHDEGKGSGMESLTMVSVWAGLPPLESARALHLRVNFAVPPTQGPCRKGDVE